MKRMACTPREAWQSKVESVGLVFHTIDGQPYWDESSCYSLTMREILDLEAATNELQRLCLEAGQHIIDRNRFKEFGLSEKTARAIREAWEHEPPAIYGRFDLAYDGSGAPKLLEYNADTPTALLEAAVAQWYWLQDVAPKADQWNSIHERLVAKWKELKAYVTEPLYFAHTNTAEGEDLMTVTYLRDTASEAGIGTKGIEIEQIGFDYDRTLWRDLDGAEMQSIFKLYPWEWLVEEEFAEQLFASLEGGIQWIEPIWKMMWSNKALLAVLWELFPNHPNLLPAYLDAPRGLTSYARKPIFSREGANVTLVRDGQQIAATDGEYGDAPVVYQALASTQSWDGKYPILGAWVVDGEAAGMGIRESDGPITGNLSRFVPHRIDD
jgi:glutathionylspermidine synthase